METFFVRLFITIGLLYLTKFVLELIPPPEPYAKLILVIAAIVLIVWLFFGATFFPAYR